MKLGWYNPQAAVGATETGAVEKPDYRIMPTKYNDNVCSCSAHNKSNDHEQIGCKWFVASRYKFDGLKPMCRYDRFEIMCDKITIDGKGIN